MPWWISLMEPPIFVWLLFIGESLWKVTFLPAASELGLVTNYIFSWVLWSKVESTTPFECWWCTLLCTTQWMRLATLCQSETDILQLSVNQWQIFTHMFSLVGLALGTWPVLLAPNNHCNLGAISGRTMRVILLLLTISNPCWPPVP